MHFGGILCPVPERHFSIDDLTRLVLTDEAQFASYHVRDTETDEVIRPGRVAHPTRQWVEDFS